VRGRTGRLVRLTCGITRLRHRVVPITSKTPGDRPGVYSLTSEGISVAKQPRQPVGPESSRSVKVQAVIDASQYVRLAAGAATLGVSHSRFVSDAIEARLQDMGIYVGRRRSAGQLTPSVPVEESADVA
jgi:hypothetical protein